MTDRNFEPTLTTDPEKMGSVLLVEDEPKVLESIKWLIPPTMVPICAQSVKAAKAVVASNIRILGAVVDLGLPDGSGLDVIRALRTRAEYVPAMVLTGRVDPELINQAHALDAEYVCKPDHDKNLRKFLEGLDPFRGALSGPLKAQVDKLRDKASLTPREVDILSLATRGVPRSHLAEVLQVSENTIKSQIRSLLVKTGQSSLSEAVWLVRSSADKQSGDASR